jgi:hypothetical protein
MLAAVLDPLDRVPVSVRRKGDEEIFRIKVAADAEAAADVAFDQFDARFVETNMAANTLRFWNGTLAAP